MIAKITAATTLTLLALSAFTTPTHAAPVPTGAWPASKGTKRNPSVVVIKAGTTFDGGMYTYERSDITCTGDGESGRKNAVFIVEKGATLKNVIIGKNQREGVHCEQHDCNIINVWWDDVCEDALSIKGGSASSVSTVTGGGARFANDKVVQHNGPGKVVIDGFFADTIGKLYRSCGVCGPVARKVSVQNVLIVNPKVGVLAVNKNFGDQATLANINVRTSQSKVKACIWSMGTSDGSEPTMVGDGPLPPLCNYAVSEIHVTKI